MILSVWKPLYNKGKIMSYSLVDNDEIKTLKGKTAYKVIWVCDDINCKTKNKKHSISACHLIKPKMSYEKQICRSCQCTGEGNGRYGDNRKWEELYDEKKYLELKKNMSERLTGESNPSKRNSVKIKKNQTIIDEKYIHKITTEKSFDLLEIIDLNGKNTKFLVKCKLGHTLEKTYVNFTKKNKKFICEKCFYDSISLNLDDEELSKIENYKKQVRVLTAKNYKIHKNTINPKNLKISKTEYHLDHKYSIYEGFKNNVDYRVISAKENLDVIPMKENLSKQHNCSISLDELIESTKYLYENK